MADPLLDVGAHRGVAWFVGGVSCRHRGAWGVECGGGALPAGGWGRARCGRSCRTAVGWLRHVSLRGVSLVAVSEGCGRAVSAACPW